MIGDPAGTRGACGMIGVCFGAGEVGLGLDRAGRAIRLIVG